MLKEIGPVGGTNGGSNGQNGTTTKHCSGKYKAARDQRAKGNDGAKVYTGDSAPRGLSEAAVARLLRGAGGAIFSTGRKHFVPSMPGMGKRLLGAGVFKQLRPVLGVNNAPKEQEPTK